MKRGIYTSITCICLGICMACQSGFPDEGEEPGQAKEVCFRVSRSDDLFARATAIGFEVGDSIGIYAVKRDVSGEVKLPASSGNQAHNAKWIKTIEGWRPASLKDKVVYPQDGAKLDFYAYYPYNRDAVNPEAIPVTVKTDQSTMTSQKISDWMAARNTEGVNEGEVDLVFRHELACMEVEVQAGNRIAPTVGLKVQVTGIVPEYTYNFGTDVFTGSTGSGTIDMRRLEDSEDIDSFTFRAFLPAQTVAAGTHLFRCLQDGKIYMYQGEEVVLTRGNRTRFIFTLKSGDE